MINDAEITTPVVDPVLTERAVGLLEMCPRLEQVLTIGPVPEAIRAASLAADHPGLRGYLNGMPIRNGAHGYGLVTKLLHWVTFGVVTAQFVVGYRLEPDDAIDEGADRLDDELDARDEACKAEEDSEAAEAEEERCEEQVEREEDRNDAEADAAEDDYVGDAFDAVLSGDFLGGGISAAEWHVVLGLGIVVLAALRVLWRATTPLPPWSEAYSAGERTLQHWLEKAMLLLLFLVPLSGFLLIRAGTGLTLHIAAHVAFFVVVGLHIALQLFHTVIKPQGQLARML